MKPTYSFSTQQASQVLKVNFYHLLINFFPHFDYRLAAQTASLSKHLHLQHLAESVIQSNLQTCCVVSKHPIISEFPIFSISSASVFRRWPFLCLNVSEIALTELKYCTSCSSVSFLKHNEVRLSLTSCEL